MHLNTRNFVIEDGYSSIYLHFLNRESIRNLKTKLDDEYIIYLLKVILLTTKEKLYSNITYLWENYNDDSSLNRFVVKLVELGLIDLVSGFSTADSYLSNSQQIYKYDSSRYHMFFKNIPKGLIQLNPSRVKKENTTNFILSNFFNIKHNINSEAWGTFPHDEKVTLLEHGKIINPLIDEMVSSNAITLSLFEKSVGEESISRSLARYSTYCHFFHYIDFLSADIVTGIKNIYYYDNLSKNKLIYNMDLLSKFASELNLIPNAFILNNDEFAERMFLIRNSNIHTETVNGIRCLINAHYCCSDNLGKMNSASKLDFVNRIYPTKLLPPPTNQGRNTSVQLDELFFQADNRIKDAIYSLRSSEQKYSVFMDIWEKIMVVKKKVLILVATDVEAKMFSMLARKQLGFPFTRIHSPYHTIYSLGEIGGADLYMVQSEMGKESPGGIILTTLDTIDYLKPDAVICVGIAFGLKPKKQAMGDILVSKQMHGYDLKKIIEKRGVTNVIPRGDKVEASTKMLDRFRSGALDWDACDIHFGLIMSGSTLADSAGFVNNLVSLEPEAIGGEMEGAGLYSVASKRKIDWILVKGICDWGMNKTDQNQKLAAENAINFTFHVLAQGGFST